MNYRKDKYGNDLSVLGFGCMRFPQKLGRIDMAQTEEQIMMAYHGGVNYYDTAYIYPGSEAALGEILEKNGIRAHMSGTAVRVALHYFNNKADVDRLITFLKNYK